MGASIVYKAHCSACGAIINEEINFERIAGGYGDCMRYVDYVRITPCKCKVCGEFFSHIEIKLPEEQNEIREVK